MERLFSYGTLQQHNVQQETFGRNLDGTKDILLGYVLSEIQITDKKIIETSGSNMHPILLYTGKLNDEVEGTVFTVTKQELLLADAYEVKDYMRIKAIFKSGNMAWVYVATTQEEIV